MNPPGAEKCVEAKCALVALIADAGPRGVTERLLLKRSTLTAQWVHYFLENLLLNSAIRQQGRGRATRYFLGESWNQEE